MQNKKSTTFQKIEKASNIFFISCFVLVAGFILTDTFITKSASLKNATIIEGHFKSIEKFKVQNKFSYSYNIFILEKQSFYKIVPDYVDCFELNNFLNNVKSGESIKIYINKDSGLKFSSVQSIVGIVVNGKDYLNRDCVNDKIKSNKIYIPLIFLIAVIILRISGYLKKRKKNST